VDRFNPRSRYHLSVGISYPNEQDKASAAQVGRDAGGDIMFHGRGLEGRKLAPKNRDWTAGCIALTDDEIEDVYAMLQLRTPVMIYA
jgi:murein L,D-transpeptidase YafK